MVEGKAAPLVRNIDEIKLALVGKLIDNDHPYSWSAIVNGYDAAALTVCPNPIIRQYLAAQPNQSFGIRGVRVSHVWCDNAEDARLVARFSRIPHVVAHAEDVIGKVDAVLIPTDEGREHLERTRPFVEAGIPVFIDKPLTDREEHLREFVRWYSSGKRLMSSSAMRYSREFLACADRLKDLGALRFITVTTCRRWERYGIHAMEAAYQFLPAHGWESVTNSGTEQAAIVHVRHASGVDVVIAAIDDMDGAFGCLALYGTNDTLSARFGDSFTAFKAQLAGFVDYLRRGLPPYPFAETVELTKIIIAGVHSRQQGGRKVLLSEIETSHPC